ncbi:MAG: hypothetical protein Q9N68_00320 [Gammaproteobacteria bacterium]|nr:hypothetical protein [Gammaproteobacteria bacterium]
MRKLKKCLVGLLKAKGFSPTCVVLESGKKHPKVRNTESGDWIPMPKTPSDYRSMDNFKASLSRLVNSGQGVIFARKGCLPFRGWA